MADLDFNGNDAALKLQTHSIYNADIDEDLIDYDSDDALGRDLGLGHTANMAYTQTLDAKDPLIDTAAALAKASEPVEISQSHTPSPEAPNPEIVESGKQELHAAGGKQLKEYGNLDDPGLQDDETAEQEPVTAGPDQLRDSIHEIDYEDDGFAFDAPTADRDLQSATQGAGCLIPQNLSENANTEAPSKQYEIDWEDHEENVGYGTGDAATADRQPDNAGHGVQDDTVQGGVDDTATDAGDDNVGWQGNIDAEDEAAEVEDPETAHEPAQTDAFPAITVQYRGEEFPMFSPSSNGFFSDASILDENMKAVLDGLRAELADEIGVHDDLVFQVDKLGLEFSESSPSDTLSEINLRQVLEIHDILVKNKDFNHSRILYAYLFTRPNTMKRYEFLVESATGDKGLAEVMHLFQPPSHGNTLGAIGSGDGYEEQLGSYEGSDDNAAARISHSESEVYEELEAVYDDNDDYQDEHAAGRDEEPVDHITGDRTTAADDDEPTALSRHDDVEPNTGDDAAYLNRGIGDADDSVGHGDVSELFDPAPVVVDDHDEHFLGTNTGRVENDGHAHYDSAHDVGGPGVGRIFDHRLDPDLIDYSSAGDKNVGDDDDPVANPPDVGNSFHSELADYGAVDDEIGADEDLIDYESVGDDDEVTQHGAGSVVLTRGGDARVDSGRPIELDDGLIDYSADSFGAKQATAEDGTANSEAEVEDQSHREISQVATGDYIELEASLGFAEGSSPLQTVDGARAHGEGFTERLLDVEDNKPEIAAFADYEEAQLSASAARPGAAQGGLGSSGAAGLSTCATHKEFGDEVSITGDLAPRLDPSGTPGEAVATGLQDKAGGGAADAQLNLMKRSYPEELTGDDGNGVKRRRS